MKNKMKNTLNMTTASIGFGAVAMITTMLMFQQGANAVDLGDFSAIDQKVITQEAPKAGGIALIKEDQVMVRRQSGPILTAISATNNGNAQVSDFARISPAAGGSLIDGDLSGRPVPPVANMGLGGPNDSATDPTDPFATIQARFSNAGTFSAPDEGAVNSLAGIRANVEPLPVMPTGRVQPSVQEMTGISPAAGGTNR